MNVVCSYDAADDRRHLGWLRGVLPPRDHVGCDCEDALGVPTSAPSADHHENDSMNRVEKSPLMKRGSSQMARWSGIDVFTPSMMKSSSARRPRARASARSFPFTTSFAISES